MKIEYRKQVDSETAPWQLLTNMDELLWNGVYALRVAHDDGSHNLPFRFGNDETVTIVVKDHAHEGMLENGRTVVQTITRVDRTTGNVYVYTRTRYNAGGTHAWSYWALAGEGNAALETPKASKSSLGSVIVGDGLAVDADGKVSLAAGAVGEVQLDASITAKIASMGDKLQHAASFAVNDGIALHIGALVENNTPYSGTNYRTYTDKLLSNGEHLIVNEGYSISTYKIFDGEQEIAFVANQDLKQITLDGEHLNYQLEFKKNDATAFASSELPVVIKYFQRSHIAWSANSHMDNYIAPGTYNIRGDRTNLADGLPIYNTGSFSARLTVLAAYNCVTQVLTLLNVGGGDSNVYTRTRQGSNWGTWSKLQQNVEVGAIGLGQGKTFDHLTDNGMYSGYNVYQTGTDDNGNPIIVYETFVLVVINGYLTGGGISQLKYSLLQNGITTVATREKTGEAWSEWNDVADVKNGAVTAEKLSTDVREMVNNPLRPLFIAAGAEYNNTSAIIKKTAPWQTEEICTKNADGTYSYEHVLAIVDHLPGYYYLNGIGDITEKQMMDIYNAGMLRVDSTDQYARYKVRTNIPMVHTSGSGFQTPNMSGMAAGNGNIACFMLSEGKQDYGWSVQNLYKSFFFCKKLKFIPCPFNATGISSPIYIDAFTACVNLCEIYIYNLKVDLKLSDSADIYKKCIVCIIQRATPTTAITITLHPDAYARLADDADIVAALEAQPLVSLVSA